MTMNVFLSYAYKDEPWRDELAAYLSNLCLQGIITGWHERNISLGKEWSREIDPDLDTAQIILLLVSPDFVRSEYCYSLEMKHILQKHAARQARVIPIMLRPILDWEDTPFAGLPTLPTYGTPITTWPGRQEALLNVVKGIEAAAREPGADAFPSLIEATDTTLVGPGVPPWNLPYPRNPFFTDRERILTYLHDMPISNKAMASTQPQVISGLDGSGKTQIAIEYAYRYRDDYTAVLWVNAASREILTSDFASIADLLDLPEKDQPNQNIAAKAARQWLQTATGWLLIFDNVSAMKMVHDFLPAGARGHILMLSDTAVPRTFALNVGIQKLEPPDDALLLLRRAGIIPPDAPLGAAPAANRLKASEIATALHGLPLALELAGAYISEVQCSLVSYLNLYKLEKVALLKQRNRPMPDYLGAAAATLALAFKRLERTNPAAAELLRLCAFLHPDAIPGDIFTGGACKLGSILQPVVTDWFELQKAMRELRRYSLVQRHLSRSTLTLHRLLQAALRDSMDGEIQRQWARRTVQAVEQALPYGGSASWQRLQSYFPHMQICTALIEQWNMDFPEAARLLEQTGDYLQGHVQYEQAEPLLQRALTIREKLLGPDHPDMATSLNNLALFYEKQGRYAQAEVFFQRTLAIQEKVLGPDHAHVATILNNLAMIYRDEGKHTHAEMLFQRALAIRKKVLGPDHPGVATILNNLATLYRMQGKYAQAEMLFQRALEIRERALGVDHPDVAQSCNALAGLYRAQGKYAQAEPLYQRALAIDEQVPGPGRPDLATTLNNLALLYQTMGKYAQAEPFYWRALALYEQLLGQEHPYVASCLSNLALFYNDQGLYDQVEPLYQRALAICEKVLGSDHPQVAISLNNLATFYTAQGKCTKARPLFERALAIAERTLGPHHPDLAQLLENYAILLQKVKETSKAVGMKARANAIRKRYVQENPRSQGAFLQYR